LLRIGDTEALDRVPQGPPNGGTAASRPA